MDSILKAEIETYSNIKSYRPGLKPCFNIIVQ